MATLFENLKQGATVEQFLEWYPGATCEQVEPVIDHETRQMQAPVLRKTDGILPTDPTTNRRAPAMLDIPDLMRELARERPLFHSEADFQHALAWRIHETIPDCGIRLEYKPPDRRIYLDLWLEHFGVAIELKYRTRALALESNGEAFELRDQSANPVNRCGFLKDIRRLESLSGFPRARAGFTILLTNDPLYWKEPEPAWRDTIDAAFRLHEGRQLRGEMAWSAKASAGTMKGQEEPIRLKGSYKVRWRNYAAISGDPFGEFRYLAIRIIPSSV